MQVPIPINEAEAIVEPFWDRRISPLPKYAVIPGGELSRDAPRLAGRGHLGHLSGGEPRRGRPPVDADGTLAPDAAANPYGARAFQFWCWATLAWDSAPVDRTVLTLTRALEVDLAG